jgi:hypothetical protein
VERTKKITKKLKVVFANVGLLSKGAPLQQRLPLEPTSSAAVCCEHGDKPSRSINGEELLPDERLLVPREGVSYVRLIISLVI